MFQMGYPNMFWPIYMLEDELNMPNIYNAMKLTICGCGKFSILNQWYFKNLELSIYIMTMSHWTFEIVFGSSQETPPYLLLNPSYDGIVMTKNIKTIMLCKQWTTKSKCSRSLLWSLSKSWMSRLIKFFHIPYIL